MKASGKNLEYLDPVTNEKYLPHVIEPSIGKKGGMCSVMYVCMYICVRTSI